MHTKNSERGKQGFAIRRHNVAGMDTVLLQGKWYRSYYLLDHNAIMTGEHLTGAKPNQGPEGNVVEFTLDNMDAIHAALHPEEVQAHGR